MTNVKENGNIWYVKNPGAVNSMSLALDKPEPNHGFCSLKVSNLGSNLVQSRDLSPE